MMAQHRISRRKVVVVGAGAVGSTFCYALAGSGLADQIVLVDRNEKLARGQALDLVHGQPFFPTVNIHPGTAADYADAQLIVITAGATQQPGETRLELLKKNAAIIRSITADIMAQQSQAIILVVSNPVDVMTHVALEATGLVRERVIGSGTVLDSARLRHLIGAYCSVDVHNVHAYVLGEHGDSELAAWSMTHVAGVQIDAYCRIGNRFPDWEKQKDTIEQAVRDSAYHIIDYKGATWFGVGMALVRITGAILRGQNSVLTVSTLLNGEFGLDDVCVSVPCIVTSHGVERIIQNWLPDNEHAALSRSAETLKKAIGEVG